jgi:formate dehydrogenase subunit gamma
MSAPRPNADVEAAVEVALAANQHLAGPLLPVLHAIQDALGYVPEEAHARLAEALGLSRAEVHGVVTFYHDFRAAPPGRHVLKVCRAEACQSMGSAAIEARLHARGAAVGATTADGALTVEAVHCLGHCAAAPALVLDDAPHARVTPARLDALLDGVLPGGAR